MYITCIITASGVVLGTAHVTKILTTAQSLPLKKAGPAVTKANDDFTAARIQFADEMQKYAERGEVISDADYTILMQNIVTARKQYLSAKKTFAFISDKLTKAQVGLERLIAGIVKSVRDKEKVKAQADVLCEMAARRMEANTQKAGGITEAAVRVDQLSPYNVSIGGNTASNDSIPLAPNDGSGIMEEGMQGETGSGNTLGAEDSQKTPWDSWQNYEKVTVNDHIFAKVGDRLYSEHAVNRMQPSGNRFGPYIYQGLYGEDYGRSVAPQFVEDVISSVEPIKQSNGNLAYTSGTVKVITNSQDAVITIVTYVE